MPRVIFENNKNRAIVFVPRIIRQAVSKHDLFWTCIKNGLVESVDEIIWCDQSSETSHKYYQFVFQHFATSIKIIRVVMNFDFMCP